MVALAYWFRVSQYDPADRDEYDRYVGPIDHISDHGPREAAYLDAMTAFAQDSCVTRLEIRDPEVGCEINFGREPHIDGNGLAGLFPPDLTGYHDGAYVTIDVGRELVRAMLRDHGAWCLLEVPDCFFLRIGYDQYMEVGSAEPCERAVALTHRLGLFAEPKDGPARDPDEDSPYDPCPPADEAFWDAVAELITRHGALLLQEDVVANAERWHRLGPATVAEVRAKLGPRARLTVWPDLSADVAAVLRGLSGHDYVEFVWEDRHGVVRSRRAHDGQFSQVHDWARGARAAAVRSGFADDCHPLATAAMPDDDGVLRVR